jgi:hypothetical protein
MNGFPSSLSEPITHTDSEGKKLIEMGPSSVPHPSASIAACDDSVDKRLESLHVQERVAQQSLSDVPPLKHLCYLRWYADHANASDNNNPLWLLHISDTSAI